MVPRSRGGALDKAMELAKDLYEKEARPEALKVLVVIMDKKVIF
jgi:ATP-dependent protease HslVU (ClpYQ) peptidase subunit